MSKIKWGVLGTAMICERDTLPGMQLADNVELYAIAGRNPEKANAFKEKYGFKKAYYSYEELLQDPDIEAVYIPLPNTLHYEWTIKALQSKKHVLCEKPIAPTAKQAEEMFAAAKENGVYLMEAFAYQHSPFIKVVCDEIAAGTIGKIKFMSSSFITSDYDISNIRMRRETRGGSVYDLGVYTTSLILRVLQEEPIDCIASAKFTDEKIDCLANAILEYKSGITANMTSGMILATDKDHCSCSFEIHGEKGSIIGEDFMFNACGELAYVITDQDGNKTRKTVPTPQNYGLETQQLGRCIRNGEKPAVTEAFSLANARMIDMILEKIGY